jgi:hypothetical protein
LACICCTKGFHQCTTLNPCPYHSFLFPPPPSWNKRNRFHCSISTHVYRIFQPYSPPILSFHFTPACLYLPQTVPILHSCHSFLRTRLNIWQRTWDIWLSQS